VGWRSLIPARCPPHCMVLEKEMSSWPAFSLCMEPGRVRKLSRRCVNVDRAGATKGLASSCRCHAMAAGMWLLAVTGE